MYNLTMLGYILSAEVFNSDILNDVKFYIILAALTAALITISVLFSTKEKFKLKREGKIKEETYKSPSIVKVKNKDN